MAPDVVRIRAAYRGIAIIAGLAWVPLPIALTETGGDLQSPRAWVAMAMALLSATCALHTRKLWRNANIAMDALFPMFDPDTHVVADDSGQQAPLRS